jgi:ABC-type enterochelin transport system permease subunit
MNNVQLIVVGLLVALFTYQIWVSLVINRADEYDAKQRTVQLILIWLVPILGAAACHLFLMNSRKKRPKI